MTHSCIDYSQFKHRREYRNPNSIHNKWWKSKMLKGHFVVNLKSNFSIS